MNCYSYKQIELGQKESFTVTVTEQMMHGFFSISNDCNPLHTDDEFAKENGFSGKVVYGMLTASFLSTLAGVYLPGKNSVIHETNIQFPAPVYIGDTITYTGEVIRKNDTFNVIEIKVCAGKSDGTKVLRGKMKIGVTK